MLLRWIKLNSALREFGEIFLVTKYATLRVYIQNGFLWKDHKITFYVLR